MLAGFVSTSFSTEKGGLAGSISWVRSSSGSVVLLVVTETQRNQSLPQSSRLAAAQTAFTPPRQYLQRLAPGGPRRPSAPPVEARRAQSAKSGRSGRAPVPREAVPTPAAEAGVSQLLQAKLPGRQPRATAATPLVAPHSHPAPSPSPGVTSRGGLRGGPRLYVF